jgi:hypothetical protein
MFIVNKIVDLGERKRLTGILASNWFGPGKAGLGRLRPLSGEFSWIGCLLFSICSKLTFAGDCVIPAKAGIQFFLSISTTGYRLSPV